MSKLLWKTPVPSTAIISGVEFRLLNKRQCKLIFQYENTETDILQTVSMIFNNVVSFRCTYLPALTVDMIEASYDKLIRIENSPWLNDVSGSLEASGFDFTFSHLQICFDDGPCYEFLCENFQIQVE